MVGEAGKKQIERRTHTQKKRIIRIEREEKEPVEKEKEERWGRKRERREKEVCVLFIVWLVYLFIVEPVPKRIYSKKQGRRTPAHPGEGEGIKSTFAELLLSGSGHVLCPQYLILLVLQP